MENFSFNFGEFLVTNGKAFRISGKEEDLARNNQVLRNFLPGISIPFYLTPGVSEIFGRMFRFSEIQQFPDFQETFRGNFRISNSHFREFLVGWRGPINKKCKIIKNCRYLRALRLLNS